MNKFIFGKNSVLDAIKNNFPIKKLYLSKNIKLQNTNLPIIYCDNMQLNKLVNGNHQGYIAEIEEYKYFDFGNIQKDKPNIVLILDHIQDPQNFGAILRTANAFNVTHIIIPKDRACEVTPTVLKTSSGGFNNLKIIKVASLFDTISNLKELGFWIYASVLNEKARTLNEVKFNAPTCLIIGNEEKGISNTLIKHSDELVYIEQKGSVQSLNVSVACGILLYRIANS